MLSNFKRRILEREAATNSRHIGLRRQFNRLLIIGGMKRRFERFDHPEPPASRPRYHEPPLRPVSETGPHIFNTDSMSHLAQFMEFKDLVRPTMCRMPHIKRELEKRIIDQPDEAQRLFVEAIRGKYVEVMSCFLEARIDTEVKDDDDMTPLHIAAFHGHAASVKLLLDAGADKDVSDDYDMTPLYWAAHYGHTDVVKLLLDAGAGTVRDWDDWTPLHFAAREGRTDTVKMLLDRGADKDVRDSEGQTPLHYAAEKGHTDVVNLLRGS